MQFKGIFRVWADFQRMNGTFQEEGQYLWFKDFGLHIRTSLGVLPGPAVIVVKHFIVGNSIAKIGWWDAVVHGYGAPNTGTYFLMHGLKEGS